MRRIICHGDSLTEGKDIEVAYRWPSLLQNALGTEVINTGIGGDTTAGLLSRFATDVIPRKPDVVHANRQGHRLMADLAMSQIRKLFYLQN